MMILRSNFWLVTCIIYTYIWYIHIWHISDDKLMIVLRYDNPHILASWFIYHTIPTFISSIRFHTTNPPWWCRRHFCRWKSPNTSWRCFLRRWASWPFASSRGDSTRFERTWPLWDTRCWPMEPWDEKSSLRRESAKGLGIERETCVSNMFKSLEHRVSHPLRILRPFWSISEHLMSYVSIFHGFPWKNWP